MLDARLDLIALGWGPLVLKAQERVQSGARVEFIEILRCELIEHGADDGLPVWIFWGQRIRRQYESTLDGVVAQHPIAVWCVDELAENGGDGFCGQACGLGCGAGLHECIEQRVKDHL